jgi:hypothetical protein
MSNQNNSESFDTYNSCPNDIKNQILKEGIWQPYTERIKNLVKSEEKLWELYNAESNSEHKRLILEDIINLQPTIANWYITSKKILETDVDPEAEK